MQIKKEVSNEEYNKAYKDINNVRVMKAVTRKYKDDLSQDDLIECSLRGLLRCLSYHRDDRGQKFTTSLWRFVDWECKRGLKQKKKPSSQPNIVHMGDYENFDLPSEDKTELKLYIKQCVDKLDDPYKLLIKQYYFENYTMEEIGKINGFSKEAARQKIKRGLRKLQQICGSGVN